MTSRLSVALLFLVAAPLQAQLLTVANVSVGLPGLDGHRNARLGAWTPIYVDLRAAKEEAFKDDRKSLSAGDFELVVEASDGDTNGQFTVPTPAMTPNERRTVLTYYRPSNVSGEFELTLKTRGGNTVSRSRMQASSQSMVDPDQVLYLALGSQLSGLRDALLPKRVEEVEGKPDTARQTRRLSIVTKVGDMPARWFGYQGVDVVVLSTWNPLFLNQLLDTQSQAAAALGEWVQRGGRLVLAVGRNSQNAQKLLPRLGLKTVDLVKSERVADLKEVADWCGKPGVRFPGGDGIDTARIALKDAGTPLARDRSGGQQWPVLATVPLGTGRVFLIAFDLDAPTFAEWEGQSVFWGQLHTEMAPRLATASRQEDFRGHDRVSELASSLQRGLESFDEVPVISFGWVAFFILVYILIVGPLDYWFLKKVVKRMELTWITFPLVVLVVSVAAYFTAYKLKGNHLRINKVDVVDIHLGENEVQGTTWFALFSPRVQSYTVGVTPAPDWGGDDRPGEGTVVTTLNTPDASIGGVDRPGGQTLFRRPYRIADDVAGLRGVPVPVWASRSFSASWRRKLQSGQLIAVRDFGLTRDGERLDGVIENKLPVELTEVSLFFNGQWHSLGNLPVGSYRINKPIPRQGGADNILQWMQKPFETVYSAKVQERRGERKRTAIDESGFVESAERANALVKGMLFYSQESNPHRPKNNSGLRSIDQGWKLRKVPVVGEANRYVEEVLLVGRAVRPPYAAEEVSLDGVSPSRVWLGRLPGDEGGRESLPGFLGQDTYVRICIPLSRERP